MDNESGSTKTSLSSTDKNTFNPFREFFDIFSNLDDVIDDFYFKRMGNGEVFYGKRKYKPSGKVEGIYDGFGLSDKSKIDMTREFRAQYLEERKRRQELE